MLMAHCGKTLYWPYDSVPLVCVCLYTKSAQEVVRRPASRSHMPLVPWKDEGLLGLEPYRLPRYLRETRAGLQLKDTGCILTYVLT